MKKLFLFLSLISGVVMAQNSFDRWVPTSGTNTYTTNITGFPGSYNNTTIYLKFGNGCTGNSTIAINGLSAQPIRLWDGDSWELVISGDIPAASNAILSYDNTNSYYKAIIYENIGSGGGVLANNGLSLSGDTVQLGGDIIKNTVVGDLTTLGTDFNLSGNSVNNWAGDYTSGPYSGDSYKKPNGSDGFYINEMSGVSGNRYYYTNLIEDGLKYEIGVIGGNFSLRTGLYGPGSGTERLRIDSLGDTRLTGDSIFFTGNIVRDDTLSKIAAFDYLTGKLKYIDASAISGAITLTGDVTGSGTGSIATTLANSGISAGTYRSTTFDAKGRATAGTNPTTLSGYGITDAASVYITANRQTANYILVLTDVSKLVEMNVGSSNSLTVPPNSSVAFPTGTQITLAQYGAGLTTVVAGVGVTIRSSSGNLLSPGQYSPMVLEKIDTDEWYLWNGSEPITPAALTKTDDSNVTLTLGGSPTTSLLEATSLTLGWSGSLAGTRGGTGQTTSTLGDLLIGGSSNTWTKLAGVVTGNVLISGGVGAAPSWGKVGLTTHVSGILGAANGGTGIANNAASTLTISGNFGTTFTVSGTTSLTLPTTGTVATLAGSETLTNKTLTTPVFSGVPTGTVTSGTYTPTLTNVTNISASTAYACQYLRVGNSVTVSGKVDIDVTLGAASELGMTLPIASLLTADENLAGTASSPAAASLVSAIRADATNDRAAFVFTAVSLTNDSYYFEFTYQIK